MTAFIVEHDTREAHAAERDAIIALTLAAYAQYSAVIPAEAWQAYADSIRDTLTNDTASTRIVATQGSTIIGSALLIPPAELIRAGRGAQPYPEIRLVAVAPHARRRGVATALLDACISRARADGYSAIGLHSTEYMADAIRIYLRRGFVRSPEYDLRAPNGLQVMSFRFSLTEDLGTLEN